MSDIRQSTLEVEVVERDEVLAYKASIEGAEMHGVGETIREAIRGAASSATDAEFEAALGWVDDG